MNCEQANGLDMVEFLKKQGYHPVKIRGADYWYHSPLHEDRTPSFKINATQNTWYDFGLGKGGRLVNFVCAWQQVSVVQALQKIASGNYPNKDFSTTTQKPEDPTSGKLILQEVSDSITDLKLLNYLRKRSIDPQTVKQYCKQVQYAVNNRPYLAIGFRNNAGGYELRSPDFKGTVAPKFVTWLDRGTSSIKVFEGFFDFLSFQTLANQPENTALLEPSNFLILNSLSFFTRNMDLMEKHETIHLFLDNDSAGQKHVEQLQQRTGKVIDERHMYKDFKDLNEWLVEQNRSLRMRRGLRR
jgi:DNA primase